MEKKRIKNKAMWIAAVVVILVNLFFSVTPNSAQQSRISLASLAAKADNRAGETDIPDPDDLIIPFRQVPKDWSLPKIIDYLFN